MTIRVGKLAGVALALAMFGSGASAKADDAAAASLASRVDGWRALAPVGWALDEWEEAVGRFGDLVELLPKPAQLVCDTVGQFNIVVSVQCAYWDWVQHHGDDDRGSRGRNDDDDDRGARSPTNDDDGNWDPRRTGERPGLD